MLMRFMSRAKRKGSAYRSGRCASWLKVKIRGTSGDETSGRREVLAWCGQNLTAP
jgi:hypothetical protein